MGQYFLAANVDLKEYIDPQSIGEGAKDPKACLVVHDGYICSSEWSPKSFLILFGLLQTNSPYENWVRNRIIIVGDETSDFYTKIKQSPDWKDVTKEWLELLGLDDDKEE